jgi:hypothetical protein
VVWLCSDTASFVTGVALPVGQPGAPVAFLTFQHHECAAGALRGTTHELIDRTEPKSCRVTCLLPAQYDLPRFAAAGGDEGFLVVLEAETMGDHR